MNIAKAGWNALSIRRDELGFAIPLFVLYFLSGSFFASGQIFTETIFLKAYGAAGLSRFFIYNGIALIACGILYNAFFLTISLQRGYILLSCLFTGLIFAAGLAPEGRISWLPFGLYLANYLFTFFLDMHFFNFIFQYLTLRNSKRLLPFLLGGGKLGGITSSVLILNIFASDVSGRGLVLWGCYGALMLLPIAMLRGKAAAGITPHSGLPHLLLPDLKFFGRLARKIQMTFSSSIFTYSMFAIFIISIVNQISEFYFASIFNRAFPSKKDLASFLSAYTLISDGITLVLQLFFVSRIIKSAGVRRANYIYPVSYTACISFAALFPSVTAGILLRFYRKNMSVLFRTPVFNIIMAASPRDRMAEVKSFINGIISPLGMIAGGGMIVLIGSKLSPAAGFSLALAMGILAIAVTRFQNRAYMSSLRKELSFERPRKAGVSDMLDITRAQPVYDIVKNHPAVARAYFNQAPTMELLPLLLPRYGELDAETKENMLSLLATGTSEYAREILRNALGDGNPYIRGRALGLVKREPLSVRRELLSRYYTPACDAERAAATILLTDEGVEPQSDMDIDRFASMKLAKLSGGVISGEVPPVEFVILTCALPAPYYLRHLYAAALATGDSILLRHLSPVADRLSRTEARRILHRYRNGDADHLIHFCAIAGGLREIDKASLLDARSYISYDHMTALFQQDEKTENIVIGRLLKRKSYFQKYNYLNYLLCMNTRDTAAMEAFINYEIDKILYLKKIIRHCGQSLPEALKDAREYRLLAAAVGDMIECHRQLMLKAMAAATGVNIDDVFESNLLLKERDLENYILEYIESSGKTGRRALVILEGNDENGDAGAPPISRQYDPFEVLRNLANSARYFIPEIWPALHHCATRLSPEPHPGNSPAKDAMLRKEEDAMSTLVDRLVVLKENTLFRGLPIHELLHIAGITRDYKLPTGSTFIRAGEKGNELFILIDGEVEIYTAHKTIARLGPGSCIGELSIIDEEPRSASVKTVRDSRLISISRRDFLLTLKENPGISINVMQVITRRLREMIAQ